MDKNKRIGYCQEQDVVDVIKNLCESIKNKGESCDLELIKFREVIRIDSINFMKKDRSMRYNPCKWSYLTMSSIKLINFIIDMKLHYNFHDDGILVKINFFLLGIKWGLSQDSDLMVLDKLGSTRESLRVGFKCDLTKILLKRFLIDDILKTVSFYIG